MDWSFLSTKKISQVYYQHICQHCYFCQIKSSTLICQHCLNGLSFNLSYCETCKLPTQTPVTHCGQCQLAPPQYQQHISPLIYQGFGKVLITSLKFSSQFHACHPLCQLLANELINHYQVAPTKKWPDAIVPVPSHTKRIRERGFCHTNLLSQYLVNYLPTNIPISSHYLKKIKHSPAQHQLNKSQRKKLKAEHFQCLGTPPKHIALLDDVVTTGSTLNACIIQLKQAGVTRIDVWSFARTPHQEPHNKDNCD